MDLLILKTKDKYIRFKKDEYVICDMDKASVFPMSRIQEVREHLLNLRRKGFTDVSVNKLLIKEVPYDIENEEEL